jgi:transcriptional regulator with XRE-family HTH domain
MGRPRNIYDRGGFSALTPGERLRVVRERRKLKQREVAKIVGVSTKQFGRYERDESEPTRTVLARLALALGTSTDYLAGLSDEPALSEDENERRRVAHAGVVQW